MSNDSFKVKKSLNISPLASPTLTEDGDIATNSTTNKLQVRLNGTTDSITTEAGVKTLTNTTFDADGTGNSITNIENADIKAAANIDRSKLASGTANRVVVNDGSGVLSDAAAITTARALISDANGIPTHSAVTATELGYVSGVTSAIQTQLDAKASLTDLANHEADTTNIHGIPDTSILVTTTGTQTLTNKTLTAPVISTISNTGTLTLPTTTDTLVGRATTDTLTNKTISGATNTITDVSLTTGVTGTLPVANGGTNSSTALNNNRIIRSSAGSIVEAAAITANRALASDSNGIPVHTAVTDTELGFLSGVTSAVQTQIDAKQSRSTLTTKGDLYVATASATVARQGVGANNTVLTADSAETNGIKWASINATFTSPTSQRFTSGSGTYTTPANVLYIRVELVGGGGGGAGSGTTTTGGTGGTGGNTTFGTSLLVGNGGAGGAPGSGTAGGAGGTASLGTGPVGRAQTGATGGTGNIQPNGADNGPSGNGAGTPYGTGGQGWNLSTAVGISATANTGAGGAGGGNAAGAANLFYGGGGGAGGFVEAIIAAPSATYSYAVGAAGTAGTAGTSGAAGGAGGSGQIVVWEYYQ